MTYNIEPDEVTESVWCLICFEKLPSDEEVCVDHMVEVHGALRGTMIREMTKFTIIPVSAMHAKGKHNRTESVRVETLEFMESIKEESVQPKW